MSSHVLLIECADRPGLVHGVTGILFRRGLNVVGNHEFNFGKDVFTSVLSQANFPVLQANVKDSGTYGLAVLSPRNPGLIVGARLGSPLGAAGRRGHGGRRGCLGKLQPVLRPTVESRGRTQPGKSAGSHKSSCGGQRFHT